MTAETPTLISGLGLAGYIIVGTAEVALIDTLITGMAFTGAGLLGAGLIVGAGYASEQFTKTKLGGDFDQFLADTFFPTEAVEIPGVQTCMLYYGDSPEDGAPNKTNKVNSGYSSQLNQLSNMSVPEIEAFMGDFLAGKISENINLAGGVLLDPKLSGVTFDASKVGDLSTDISTKIKDWAAGKAATENKKTVANGTGTKVNTTTGEVTIPADVPGVAADDDNKGRPLPGSLGEISGKSAINLCDDTMQTFKAIGEFLWGAYKDYRNGNLTDVAVAINAHAKNFNCLKLAPDEETTGVDDELNLRRTIAEVARDKTLEFGITTENIFGDDN